MNIAENRKQMLMEVLNTCLDSAELAKDPKLNRFINGIIEDPEQLRLVLRLNPRGHETRRALGETSKIMILDTETTGVDPTKDRIVEFAYAIAEFDATTGAIVSVLKYEDQLQDPGFPIPAEATAIHGLYDADVAGHVLNKEQIRKDLEEVDFVVAHVAKFDRQMLETDLPEFKAKKWACTYEDVDWTERGFESSKLEYLGYRTGFYYDRHRALIDTQALMEIIIQNNLFPELKKATKSVNYALSAERSPMSSKDSLKANGYSALYIGGKFKTWYKMATAEELEQEIVLARDVIGLAVLRKAEISAIDRFSSREPEVLDAGELIQLANTAPKPRTVSKAKKL